jgi:hypothetical protein
MKLFAFILLLALTGCSSIDVQDGDFRFRRISAATLFKADSIEYEVKTNGVRVIRLKKASSDGVTALEKIAEGAARGAVSGAK